MKKRTIGGWLMLIQFALPIAASAGTPCDTLRDELQTLARQRPEATEDTGDGRFLYAVVGPKIVEPSLGVDCKSFGEWVRKAGFDTSLAGELDEDRDGICWSWLNLYDRRGDGGFIALAGTQGSAHCPVVQVFNLDKDELREGWSWDSDCSPASFEVVRVGGRAYPAMFRPKLYDKDLSYHVDLISLDPAAGSRSCALSIVYQAEFGGRWFGPKGEDDVAREVREAIAPIVLDLANGTDATSSIRPWVDRQNGDSPYDLAISGYPKRPVDGMRYPNTGDHVYPLPWGAPFLTGHLAELFYSGNGLLDNGTAIPLSIQGRRLLLVFGYATTYGTRALPDPAFGVWEYNDKKRDFDAVAGGVIERHGRNPEIR